MQEIKKRRIVIASVLKPVDDSRMFEKIGISLAKNYDVHIIGYPSQHVNTYPSIQFYPLSSFSRLSWKRILCPFIILKSVLSIRPSVFIITTHELLSVAIMAKWLCRCKIIYDIQENYFRNILFTNSFPFLLRPLVASCVRLKEWVTQPFMDHFFFAEAAYESEMNFIKKRTTLIENKYKRIVEHAVSEKKSDGKIHLLFSGTLSETTGVFNAIRLASSLRMLQPEIHLTIIGFCALHNEYERLIREVTNRNYITLIGGNHLVPHKQIIQHIKASHYGIVSYPKNPSTEKSVPTKLYEYMANELPILLINNPHWVKICAVFQAAIPFDAENIDAAEIIQGMAEQQFYDTKPTGIFWESEEQKLLEILKSLKI